MRWESTGHWCDDGFGRIYLFDFGRKLRHIPDPSPLISPRITCCGAYLHDAIGVVRYPGLFPLCEQCAVAFVLRQMDVRPAGSS